jgi:transcription elongation GreA/GreB family factor
MQPLFFTKSGLEKHQKHIAELEERMNKLKIQLAEMADVCGDEWHDNFMFEQTIVQVADLEHFINEARDILKKAILVSAPLSNEEVNIGHRLRARFGEREINYQIGGHGESEPSVGLLAYDTPIGKVLLGMKIGEKKDVELGGKNVEIEILEIL